MTPAWYEVQRGPRSNTARRTSCLLAIVLTWVATGLGAQTLSFTPVGAIAGPIDLVDAVGTRAYLARHETLTVYDITDPVAPHPQGSHTFPEQIWGFSVVDSTVYVAAGHSGLFILDVSDPTQPAVRGSLTTPGQAKNVAVVGNRAVVADHMSGIDLVDVSDRATPVSLGSVFTDGYARDVAMAGAFAYGVDNPSGFYVLNLEQPDPLEPVGMIQSAPAPRFVDILTADPAMAVMLGGAPYDPLRALRSESRTGPPPSALHVYDISDPTMPEPLASIATPGRAQRMALRNRLAYVADGDAGLSVVDFSIPSDPRLVGQYQTDRPARDVAVADTAVLVLIGVVQRGEHTQDDGDVILLTQSQ